MEQQHTFKDLFKPSWYIHQMSGWSTSSYILLLFGYLFIAWQTFSTPLNAIAIWTFVAAILGFTTTLAITNTRPLNGVFGLISALIYIVVAIHAKNPSDAILQGVYIVLLDIPVLISPNWAIDVEKKVRKISEVGARNEKHDSSYWYKMFSVVFFAAWIVLYFFEIYITKTPRPIIDSFTAAIGITGALLTTLRFSESYYFWIIQGAAQVALWGVTAVQGDASLVLFFTYMLYLANDAVALLDKKIAWFHHTVKTSN
ncbi:nicotinamide mononucleotide transporter [Oenococcus oeni]|nr:nicotinamide mononucleotide transporter [Oenococcus oeni]